MKTDQIRKTYIDFFKSKDHTHVASDLLVPKNDHSLLFTGAGMNQFKEQFAGKDITYKRAVTAQKCLRTGDLENVGKTASHHTFFEMLGNFSFGDYFKKEAIGWAWEYLTQVLELAPDDLTVTVHESDDEAYDIWKNDIGLPAEKITHMGDEDNFWPANAIKAGPNGPCGPCSEIFYKGTEVWNLVFTQFNRAGGGELEPLPAKNIDTGMGLERLARVMQGVETNFDIDIFVPVREELVRSINVDKSTENAIMDHARAAVFCIGDNILPSNEGRNYVVRKLIRRAYIMGRTPADCKPFLYKLVPVLVQVMKEGYPELEQMRDTASEIIKQEEAAFEERFREFLPRFEAEITRAEEKGSVELSADFIFAGYDTYGIPIDIQAELAAEKGLGINKNEVEKLIEKQKATSRAGSNIASDIFSGEDIEIAKEIKTVNVDGESDQAQGYKIVKVLPLADTGDAEGQMRELVIVSPRPTHFYCEGGGQVGDSGLIKAPAGEAAILKTTQFAGHSVFEVSHAGTVELKEGDDVSLELNDNLKAQTAKNHTATHLLHYALRKVLGEHVTQAGSLVAPDRLRFDFTHNKKVTAEELEKVEEIINGAITKGDSVGKHRDLSIDEAKAMGAMSLFGEKYGKQVTVIDVGGYSKEFCGGTHVDNAAEIESFKITYEGSVASGIRRIEALTGTAVREWMTATLKKDIDMFSGLENLIKKENLTEAFDANVLHKIAEMVKALTHMITELAAASNMDMRRKFQVAKTATAEISKEYQRAYKEVQKKQSERTIDRLKDEIDELIKSGETVNGTKIVFNKFPGIDIAELRKLKDMVKNKSTGHTAVFFTGDNALGKTNLLLWFSDDLVGENKNAGSVIQKIAAKFDAKGGGKPDMAQAGLKEKVQLDDVIDAAREILQEELS